MAPVGFHPWGAAGNPCCDDYCGAPTSSFLASLPRTSPSMWAMQAKTAKLPPQTRSLVTIVTLTRSAGAYNDGYADALVLKLTNLAP